MTLHEAMKRILEQQPNHTMDREELADHIWNQGLYFRQDGNKAESWQLCWRARKYPHLFTIDGHNISLND